MCGATLLNKYGAAQCAVHIRKGNVQLDFSQKSAAHRIGRKHQLFPQHEEKREEPEREMEEVERREL